MKCCMNVSLSHPLKIESFGTGEKQSLELHLTDCDVLVILPTGLGGGGRGGGGLLPIMAYTGRHRPKGVPFSGFRYIKG